MNHLQPHYRLRPSRPFHMVEGGDLPYGASLVIARHKLLGDPARRRVSVRSLNARGTKATA